MGVGTKHSCSKQPRGFSSCGGCFVSSGSTDLHLSGHEASHSRYVSLTISPFRLLRCPDPSPLPGQVKNKNLPVEALTTRATAATSPRAQSRSMPDQWPLARRSRLVSTAAPTNARRGGWVGTPGGDEHHHRLPTTHPASHKMQLQTDPAEAVILGLIAAASPRSGHTTNAAESNDRRASPTCSHRKPPRCAI